MPQRPATTAIVGLRATAGLACWAAPGMLASPLGGKTGSAALITRLFAVRDAGYAASLLAAPPATRARLLQIGIATDLIDAAACVIHLRARDLPRRRGLAATATAFLAAGLGIGALREQRRADGNSTPYIVSARSVR